MNIFSPTYFIKMKLYDCLNMHLNLVGRMYITNFPLHDMRVEIMWKLFYHEFVFFVDKCCATKICMMHVRWNIFKWVKIFHPTYMCIIHVLNTQHLCAKNMNPWNNKFHVNFEWTNEAGRFVMYRWNLLLWNLSFLYGIFSRTIQWYNLEKIKRFWQQGTQQWTSTR